MPKVYSNPAQLRPDIEAPTTGSNHVGATTDAQSSRRAQASGVARFFKHVKDALQRIERAPHCFQRAGAATLAAPENSVPMASLSSPIKAMFGLEIEIPDVTVHCPEGSVQLDRGSVLLRRPLWALECDRKSKGVLDLECVTEPLSTHAQLTQAISEITALSEQLREQANNGQTKINLQDVCTPLNYTSNVACQLSIATPHLTGCVQATYGIPLEKIPETLESLLDKHQTKRIEELTGFVGSDYHVFTSQTLTPACRGFIQLIVAYLERANTQVISNAAFTVHAYFRLMSRSDFCSMFEQLLTDEEKQTMRYLLLPIKQGPKAIPPLMMSIKRPHVNTTVFAKPYLSYSNGPDTCYSSHTGPTVKEWLASIVEGRGEGHFKKDLMSPPQGYPLHTGNMDLNYGMGAMGVDVKNRLVLFEVRGAPYREKNIPLNGQLLRFAEQEMSYAIERNPTLNQGREIKRASDKRTLLKNARNGQHALAMLRQLQTHFVHVNAEQSVPKLNLSAIKMEDNLLRIASGLQTRKPTVWASALATNMQALADLSLDFRAAKTVNEKMLNTEQLNTLLSRTKDLIWQSEHSQRL